MTRRRSFFITLTVAWAIPIVAIVAALTRSAVTAYFARQAYWLHSARGSRCYAAGDYACAAAEYAQMIALQPDRADGYRMRGRALLQLARYAEAAQADTAALAHAPTAAAARHGATAAGEDDREAAAQILCDRGRAEAAIGGRNAAAIADVTRAIHLWPDVPDAHALRMQILYRSGRSDEALADADAVIRRRDDGIGDAYVIRSRVAERQERYARAAHEMAEACRIEPGVADHWLDLAWLQFRAGEALTSAATYREALIHAPDNGRAWLRLTIAYMAVGNPDAALDAVNTGLPRATAEDRAGARRDLRVAYRTYPAAAADQFDRVSGWLR